MIVDGWAVEEDELERQLRETVGVECAALAYAMRKTAPEREARANVMQTIAMTLAMNFGTRGPLA